MKVANSYNTDQLYFLIFWLSIACKELGDDDKAQKYFDLALEKVEDHALIPEQVFCCRTEHWVGVSPLLWSHAKHVLAAWKLNMIE